MTPGARIAAAIEILDAHLAGDTLERCLSRWARTHRFAGSKDRYAIRDHVYQAIRRQSAYGWVAQGSDGRALMIGQAHCENMPIGALFDGQGHAPPPLSDSELEARDLADAPPHVALDCQGWVWQALEVLGPDRDDTLRALGKRAPVFLRVNNLKSTLPQAQDALASDEIETIPDPLATTALQVTQNPRKVAASHAYSSGLVELQDAASQATIEFLGLQQGQRVLDYCAGGGGKTLAIAAQTKARVVAHDRNPRRMKDLPARAKRAGATVEICKDGLEGHETFDVVICDVPCSGSGSWRRDPEGKWRITKDRITQLVREQSEILRDASKLVKKGGTLAYITCSILEAENTAQIAEFVASNSQWTSIASKQFLPLHGSDGFFVATLTCA